VYSFSVQLFPLKLKRLLSHSSLYIYTFRNITSQWYGHKHSLGTQNLLLHMVTLRDGTISSFDYVYPDYITDELLVWKHSQRAESSTYRHCNPAACSADSVERRRVFGQGFAGYAPARGHSLRSSTHSDSTVDFCVAYASLLLVYFTVM